MNAHVNPVGMVMQREGFVENIDKPILRLIQPNYIGKRFLYRLINDLVSVPFRNV